MKQVFIIQGKAKNVFRYSALSLNTKVQKNLKISSRIPRNYPDASDTMLPYVCRNTIDLLLDNNLTSC